MSVIQTSHKYQEYQCSYHLLQVEELQQTSLVGMELQVILSYSLN